MKNVFAVTVLTALVSQPALSLSCLKPDVANAFAEASASDLSYVVVKGSFDFSKPDGSAEPQEHNIAAVFSGRLLTNSGFTQQVSAPVEITLTCEASWCAQLEPGEQYISFIENHNNEKLIYKVSPCYVYTFFQPSEDDIKRLENCAQGGACLPAK